jgi:monoamine oxidase
MVSRTVAAPRALEAAGDLPARPPKWHDSPTRRLDTDMARNDYEATVVGGGAAGVAAARRLREAGVATLLIEARQRLGGRAWSVRSASGFPLDLGCGWLHSADRNPWREIAEARKLTIDRTPPPWTRPSAQTGFPAAEQAAFVEALTRFRESSEAAGELEPDRPASALVDKADRWYPLINAVSTFYSGAELDRVSMRDLARYDDTGVNWRVVDGYGTLVAAYGEGLDARLACKAQRIDRRGRRLRVETSDGPVETDAAIVALPSSILAEQSELFLPALPQKSEAAAGLPLGLADKLFLSLEGAEQFDKDSRCFGRTDRSATAAYHLRPFGRPMIEAYFGGPLAADLETGGEAAFFAFASAELAGLFGADFARRITPLHSHSWGADPLSRGSYSYALPGKADCRAVLAAPVDDRLFFAGEACSKDDYSTAHGAYLTGLAAADQAIAALRRTRAKAV